MSDTAMIERAIKAWAEQSTTNLRVRLSQLGTLGADAVPRFGVAHANQMAKLAYEMGGFDKPKAPHPWAAKDGAKGKGRMALSSARLK